MIGITDFLGWIGVIVSICFLTSPILQFINLIKKKINYTEINILIILGNYVSSIVWLIYGYQIKIKQLIVCYSLGSLISLIWIWIYLVYMGKKKIKIALICTMVLSFLTLVLYILLTTIVTDRKMLGEICFIVCSLSYISPSQLLIKVLNSKDHKLIPIYSAIIATIGYGSWTLFGFVKWNATIIIPNIVGLFFSLAQIILYRVYKNKKQLSEELNNISHSIVGTMKNAFEKTVEIASSINPISNPTAPSNNNPAPVNATTDQGINFDSINNNENKNYADNMFNTKIENKESGAGPGLDFDTNVDKINNNNNIIVQNNNTADLPKDNNMDGNQISQEANNNNKKKDQKDGGGDFEFI